MGHTEKKAQDVSTMVGPVLIIREAAGRGNSDLPGIPKAGAKDSEQRNMPHIRLGHAERRKLLIYRLVQVERGRFYLFT